MGTVAFFGSFFYLPNDFANRMTANKLVWRENILHGCIAAFVDVNCNIPCVARFDWKKY